MVQVVFLVHRQFHDLFHGLRLAVLPDVAAGRLLQHHFLWLRFVLCPERDLERTPRQILFVRVHERKDDLGVCVRDLLDRGVRSLPEVPIQQWVEALRTARFEGGRVNHSHVQLGGEALAVGFPQEILGRRRDQHQDRTCILRRARAHRQLAMHCNLRDDGIPKKLEETVGNLLLVCVFGHSHFLQLHPEHGRCRLNAREALQLRVPFGGGQVVEGIHEEFLLLQVSLLLDVLVATNLLCLEAPIEDGSSLVVRDAV
mmetsp:Transcript_87609/g.220427  ORF Transcript_87609/g.220427 Transcript_87609/m.220427 type:complete len:257 (+) Transcript_87609:3-773(+)